MVSAVDLVDGFTPDEYSPTIGKAWRSGLILDGFPTIDASWRE